MPGNKNILIVDDAAETRLFLKGLVTDLGYNSYEAKNAYEANKLLTEKTVDLLVLDIFMPGADCYSVLDFIKKNAIFSPPKTIIFSSKSKEKEQERLNQASVKIEFVHKTTDIQVLKNKIKSAMGG